MRGLVLLLPLVGACADDVYTVVTVNARPGVHDAASITVTLQNAGAMRTEMIPLATPATFPISFSLSAPGRAGDLQIAVEAESSDMLPVGAGTATAQVGAKTADVMLDTTDFVVNNTVANDQYLSNDFEANGLQLAAASDGTWTVGWRDSCDAGACTIWGRRFDAKGVPQKTAAAASTNEFPFSTTLTQSSAYPALAASGTTTVALWDFTDTVGTGRGIACRAIDATGNATPGQAQLSADPSDVVTAAALPNGNFVSTWQIIAPNDAIRMVVFKPDCTPLGTVLTVSSTVGTASGPHRSHVTANGQVLLTAWLTDGDVHIRTATLAGSFQTPDTNLIPHTATYVAQAVRVAPLGTSDFAVVVRSGNPAFSGPGKIEVFHVSSAGALVGAATLITDKSLSDFASGEQGFGVATRSDGATLIAWHQCDDMGTAGSCDVFGRLIKPTGAVAGDVFGIPTTTLGDQTDPAVAALPHVDGQPDAFAVSWNDTSHLKPDEAGSAVRARILYPTYDPNAP